MSQVLYPNVWGRAALFSYSGLEGECTMFGTMVGQLMQDQLGMRLDKTMELYILPRTSRLRHIIVASDLIEGVLYTRVKPGEIENPIQMLDGIFKENPYAFLALNQNTVVGYCPKAVSDPRCRSDFAEELSCDEAKLFQKGKLFYAFVTAEGETEYTFAVARADSAEKAIADAKAGLLADIRAVADQRRAYFDKVPVVDGLTEIQQRTLAKTFSIMKGQVNSPEGVLTCRYTTPDRIPHQKMWLWDSAFHSVGNVYLDPELAHETLYAVLLGQREDGMIFHSMCPEGGSIDRTQPPILAWAYWKLYKKTGRADWVEEAFPILEGYLDWNFKNRDQNQNLLFEWFTDPWQPTCRCGESGMDNTPRFDTDAVLEAIDFSCFMANEMRCMSAMAKLLNKPEAAAKYAALYQKIGDKVNDCLFDAQDQRYYDRELETGAFSRIPTVSSFLPLFAGICPPERANKLIDDLCNPATFGTKHMVPTVAKNHQDFSNDYWRGATWICYNYMIEQGCRENGFVQVADRIVDATVDMVSHWYGRAGCIFEVYDPDGVLCSNELHRKGHAPDPTYIDSKLKIVQDFGWSSTLYTAMVMERQERNKK